jgi:DNA modification methylase
VSEKTNIEGFHVADCVNFMTSMPCECVDLVVTSPPYDNLKTSIWKYERML